MGHHIQSVYKSSVFVCIGIMCGNGLFLIEKLRWDLAAPVPHDFIHHILHRLPLSAERRAHVQHYAQNWASVCYAAGAPPQYFSLPLFFWPAWRGKIEVRKHSCEVISHKLLDFAQIESRANNLTRKQGAVVALSGIKRILSDKHTIM